LQYDTEYIVEESNAPDRYNKLKNSIHVKVTSNNGVEILNPDDFKEGYVTKTQDTTNELNVVNVKNVDMPKAGGIGNYWIYILGIFIMLSTVIIYMKRIKKIK
jgi:LPXTG-motif cell wall-anchored protein